MALGVRPHRSRVVRAAHPEDRSRVFPGTPAPGSPLAGRSRGSLRNLLCCCKLPAMGR